VKVSEKHINNTNDTDLATQELDAEPVEKVSVLSMVLSKPFLLIYLMNTMSLVTGVFVVGNFKTYAQINGLVNESYLTWLGSIASVLSAARFIWSTASMDYFSYRTIYAVLLVMQIILCMTMPLVSKNAGLYAIWVCLVCFCEGGHFSMVPNVVKKIFGKESTGLYGILYSYSGVCAIMLIIF
jgi:Na+/melibiose symporter-like transporter